MRTLGITVIGTTFVIIGGITSFIVLFEVVDSLSNGGVGSIVVYNLRSFRGFMVFAFMPLFIYSLGMGVLLLQPWARKTIIFIFPLLVMFFMVTSSNFLFWLIAVSFLVYYFTRPEIKSQYE